MVKDGDIFGSWTVLHKDPSNGRKWVCSCDCGAIKSVYEGTLSNGASTSCGCSKIHISPGDVFGKLTVMERTESSDRGNSRWLCSCECGDETTVVGTSLSKGMTKSCGCTNRTNGHRSSNETMVSIALETMGIPFEYEPQRFDLGNGSYTPDFFLPTMNLWMEVKSSRFPSLMKAAAFALDHDLLILTEENLSILCGGKSIFYLYIKGRDDIDEVRSQIESSLSVDTNREDALAILTNWKDCTQAVAESRLKDIEEETSLLRRITS